MRRMTGLVTNTCTPAALAILLATGCAGTGGGKDYDIAPIFPASADKCERYHGTQTGKGFSSSCMVTKDDCEKAAADWREAMENIHDAIVFTCD
jgi:hypothetical protein